MMLKPTSRQSSAEARLSQPVSLGNLTKYIFGNFQHVRGWCDVHLWSYIQPIHQFHLDTDLKNRIAEIGVYHGKFFFGLLKLSQSATANFAIDVFEMQEFNMDRSGEGDLET